MTTITSNRPLKYPPIPVGSRFGSWTTISEEFHAPNSAGHMTRYIVARCDCGAESEHSRHSLIRGMTTRCRQCSNRAQRGRTSKFPMPVPDVADLLGLSRQQVYRQIYRHGWRMLEPMIQAAKKRKGLA